MGSASPEPNGKATIGLVVQIAAVVIGVIGTVATPLILMYSKLNALEVTMNERLSEIETQFRAADEYRNINLANQMRWVALLWQKTYGEPLPGEVYFPAISKH